jgi:hypothetical protein
MKKLISLSLLLFLVFYAVNARVVSLKEAIDKKLITADIKANEKSTHYHTPFIASLKNNSRELLEVVLDNGFVLVPDNEDYQHFIVTQQLLVKLKPFEAVSKPVHAMCIKQNKAAPAAGVKYALGYTADETLVKLSKFVEQTKAFEPNAQFLLWEMISHPLKAMQIDTFELYEVNRVRPLGKAENGQRKEVVFGESDYSEPETMVQIQGSFRMTFGYPRNVHIAMFNMQNVMVRELYNNPKTPPGDTMLAYKFNSLEFPDEEYTIKLVVNGEIMMNRKVDMSK